jgi:hypothetical protein
VRAQVRHTNHDERQPQRRRHCHGEYLGQKAREGRARAREAVEQGREIYDRQRENLSTAVERGREAFQQARTQGDQLA